MTAEQFAGLILFAFVSSITPGPNNLMLLTSGVNYGLRRTVPHMLGIAGGFTFMLAVIGLGLSGLFTAVPALQLVLKVLCLAYLLYLAWRMARSGPIRAGEGNGRSRPMAWYEAVAFQWVNPKAWAMALTAFAAYAAGKASAGALLVAGIFGLVNLPCILAWALFGVGLRGMLSDPKRVRVFNFVMAFLLVVSVLPFLR